MYSTTGEPVTLMHWLYAIGVYGLFIYGIFYVLKAIGKGLLDCLMVFDQLYKEYKAHTRTH